MASGRLWQKGLGVLPPHGREGNASRDSQQAGWGSQRVAGREA